MSWGKARVRGQGAAKFLRGSLQISKLSFGQPEFQMQLCRRSGLKRLAQFAFRCRWAILLRVNARQEPVRPGVCRIERKSCVQLLKGGGLLVKIEPRCAQTIVRVRPFRFEPKGSLELLDGPRSV